MTTRKILHLDLDAFFCAVEELRDPSLRGKAFAVGGLPEHRGVVSSCSYAARQYGVHSAQPMGQAMRLCPNLLIIAPHYNAYREMSEKVMAILRQRTAMIEQISIDEAFLDLTDLPQPGLAIAQELQREIREQLGLPCSLGVAANKLLAKIATDTGKAKHRGPTPPCAVEVVPPGQEAAYLAPLPARALWGVGPKTAAKLAEMGIHTIGEIASLPEALLARHFGQNGHEMSQHARGLDDRPVVSERAARSISQEVTFERDVSSPAVLLDTLRTLSEAVARSVREKKLCAGTIRLKIRWPDFTTLSRQVSFDQPVDQDSVFYEAAVSLFRSVWSEGRPVRLIGVAATRLTAQARQLSLWDTPDQKERRLLDALDDLRDRYGKDVVRSGRAIRRPKRG
ncbi:MAG TPA: DNA polymerase IV [Anaerolineaceae bacterium]